MAYNVKEEYSKKSVKQLEKIVERFTGLIAEYPDVKHFNEHLQFTKMMLAERIGKK